MPSVAFLYPLSDSDVPWEFRACGTYDTAPSVVVPPDTAAAAPKAAGTTYQVKVTATATGMADQVRLSGTLVASDTPRNWQTTDKFVFTANRAGVKFKAELLGTAATAEKKNVNVSDTAVTFPSPCPDSNGGGEGLAGKGAKAAPTPGDFFYFDVLQALPQVTNVVFAIIRRSNSSPDSPAEYLSVTTADHRYFETAGFQGNRYFARLPYPVRDAGYSYFILAYSLDKRDRVLSRAVQLLL